jgi:ribose transport system ATP-binding protein
MDEVFRVCDTATILRDGRKVADVIMAETSESAVIARMVGRELAAAEHKGFAQDEIVLEVSGLTRGTAVRDATFNLRRGEVLGISGLVGAGRTELLRLIAGVDQPDSGQIRLGGKPLSLGNPRKAIASGLGLLPEERKREGILARRSVRSNITLSSMHKFSKFGFVRRKAAAIESLSLMTDLNLKPLNIERPIGQFSGGNQQKAIIGRWIAAGAQILLFDEPTRGIDVGAKAEIYTVIERLAAEGRSVIVVSSELPEILRVADRVLVMREGRIAGMLQREGLTEQAIVALAVPQSQS